MLHCIPLKNYSCSVENDLTTGYKERNEQQTAVLTRDMTTSNSHFPSTSVAFCRWTKTSKELLSVGNYEWTKLFCSWRWREAAQIPSKSNHSTSSRARLFPTENKAQQHTKQIIIGKHANYVSLTSSHTAIKQVYFSVGVLWVMHCEAVVSSDRETIHKYICM